MELSVKYVIDIAWIRFGQWLHFSKALVHLDDKSKALANFLLIWFLEAKLKGKNYQEWKLQIMLEKLIN